MMPNRPFSTAVFVAALTITLPGSLQAQPGLMAGVPDSAVLADLRPRNIGPAVMSGRVSDIAVAPNADDRPGMRLGRIMYVATAGGGVWKTESGGKTWTPVFHEEGASSIGDVAVTPSNPDVVWVGTGESNNLRSSSWGDGIYRSTDAGETWTHMGLRGTQHIARILVHPTNADIVYVASPGPLWASGGERGIFKTTDGGRTWANVKTISENTGFTDIVMDPTNPDVLYAASYQRERRPWSFIAGGPESGIWKSTDAGATWMELTNGLPTGDMGRIGLDISQSQPRTVYAVVHAEDEGGVYRTDDGGATWTRPSDVSSIPWFFGQIRVDPQNAERVYFLGVQLQVSDDGAKTWRNIAQGTHADNHAMWIDPRDSNHLALGNDGGFFVSYDRGVSFDFASNLPASTFYAIGIDMREPHYWVYGGLQDNGTWGAPSQTRDNDGVNNHDWVRVAGGDGFYAAIDPTDPTVVYAESQNGNLRRVELATGESKAIRPSAPEGVSLRYNWSAPIVISSHDNRTLYFGANHLFRSRDRGDSWEILGGDLTRALDRDTLLIMGRKGPGGLGRHDGTAPFGNIATIDESKLRAGLLYVGTDDGVISVSRDGGANWTRVERFTGVPELTYVSRVIASTHDEGTAYATFDGHRDNDFKPYVFKSTDFGGTWTSITSNLPAFGSVQVIREHHRNPNLLFVGTEFGVFVSVDGGGSWTALGGGFPTVAVHDLIIHPRDNDLIIGTHGRGIWILDDLTPLEQLAVAGQARIAHVFTPRAATTLNRRGGDGPPGQRQYDTSNPPAGATLSYSVAAGVPANTTLTLAIVDAAGEVVRTLPASSRPGVHRTTWNLRWSPAAPPPPRPQAAAGGDEEEEEDDGPPFGGGAQDGPYVAPGQYTVQLRSADAGGQPQTVHQASLTVLSDPLVPINATELAQLQEWRMKAYRTQIEANVLVQRLNDARTRLAADSVANRGRITEVDSTLVALRGPQRRPGQGGGGGGGGFGGGGANRSLLGQLNGVASAIATLHFLPTAEQRTAIDNAVAELGQLRPRVEAVLQGAGGADADARPAEVSAREVGASGHSSAPVVSGD